MIHVVGAGVAGLVAAQALLKAGRPVTLHEAAPGAGGRARALPDGTDNGTHALIGANRAALGFLDAIGARAGWVEPEPDGLPVLDLDDGSRRLVALSPLGWWRRDRRPAGVSPAAVAALAALALPGRDRTVAQAMARHPAFLRGFVDPLVIAALNTPTAEAGTRRLAQVLRRLGAPGATRLFVARNGLGPDMVEPALAAIRALGGTVVPDDRLRKLDRTNSRATALHLHSGTVALAPEDRVVLAVPPWEATRLLTHVEAPMEHAPIVNLHFARTGPGPVRFVGLLGALCQWVLVRPDGVAVTVSAGDAEAREEADSLAPRAWREIRAAAQAFALPGEWPEAPPPCRAVKERRATPRQRPGPIPAPRRRHLENLVLAGDWTWPHLPATIEAAAQSGLAAAREAA
ncbi:FAD-dependent oxidoreductase [Roseococcus sp. DSY-14]|uniref:hydroxysqualene dehydroxylase n=1 Tax=Roseococcus sp. DSY-14 TaxID=3369650 RepID=UPI00387B9554